MSVCHVVCAWVLSLSAVVGNKTRVPETVRVQFVAVSVRQPRRPLVHGADLLPATATKQRKTELI